MPTTLFPREPAFEHGRAPAVGVLVANLGTPAAPTPRALRAYLKQFLWDRRVIEASRPLWWLILHLAVLTRRPRASAALYRKIWTPEGSPLLVISRRLAAALGEGLRARWGPPIHVALGMTYGEPSIAAALAELRAAQCRRILVLPLYSHYSSTSTGAVFDAVMRELMTWRWVPEVRTVQRYHDEPGLIGALAASVRALWQRDGEGEVLVQSFHGIPRRYVEAGDPYPTFCRETARLLAAELGLGEDRARLGFQSRFGREEWLRPYTDELLKELAGAGVRRLDVICPGFGVDCLETLEEIDGQFREVFLAAGGERFRYVPALNAGRAHVEVLLGLLERHLQGWATP